MSKAMTITEFFKQFPDDDACLDHLFKVRYGKEPVCPKCGQIDTFHKLSKMPAYTCNCGHHIHPMVDTPFHRTRTPLQKWFFAMFMFTTTRNGVAAKEIQRQMGVTYKTAWRMARLIREYMGLVDGDAPIGGSSGGAGIVEIDEVGIGGKDKRGFEDKVSVLGMVERGGEVVSRVVKRRTVEEMFPIIAKYVRPGSRIVTDELPTYTHLHREGYWHAVVNHSAKEYARGSAHTNTIESFWAMVKRTIAGTHIWVSEKHLPKYLGEIEFRWNLRRSPELMFRVLLVSFQRP